MSSRLFFKNEKMKIEFSESRWETAITLFPETSDEVAQLFRMVKNTKAEKPYLFLQFNSEQGAKIYGHISMKKIREASNKVITSVNNQ